MSEKRKLAAILASDVVGYSRLAGADEDRILARLRALRSDLIDPTISVHNGRVVKRTGDGSIVEFRSVVDAVRCAIEVQNAMVERNSGVPEDRRIVFRIGIHVGDVVEENDGDLMGDGINIAARLESVCEPGGVCLSEDAFRQARDRLKENFVDIGEKTLKNISRPLRVYALAPPTADTSRAPSLVAPLSTQTSGISAVRVALTGALVLAVLAAGWFGWRAWSSARQPAASVVGSEKLSSAPRLSIIVLPFENLSGDPEQEYFADGITEDLTTDLSRLPESFVIARNTAFTYKGKPIDVKQIGRDLGVRYVLEGSVRRLGETITLNAQLISTETGAHVWADRFEGERSRLGQLQVEFVSRLANSLGVELVKAESLRAIRERPNNPDAVDLAMRGRAILNGQWSKAAFNEAATLFERALALDPENVPAEIGLSQALSRRANNFFSQDREGDLARAEEAIDRAISIQPENSIAHDAKAHLFYGKRQMGAAIAEAERAIALDHNNAGAIAYASFLKVFTGRSQDGFAGIETAMQLSPRDPLMPMWQYYICHLHTHLAQWDEAIEWCAKSHAGDPKFWWTLVDLAAANAWSGHDKEAREATDQLLKVYPGFTVQKFAGIKFTDNPTFNAEYARIVEGLRKTGLPEQ